MRFFPKLRFMTAAMVSTVLTLAAICADARTVVDQIGRKVEVPDEVHRVVVLQHQTLNLLVQLDASDKIVGVLSSWKKQLGPEFERFIPAIKNMPEPGDLTSVNLESLLALQPDVVFIANYAPKDMIEAIERSGIPAVAISLRRDEEGEKDKLNPTMADEDAAYSNGLQDGIRLIAQIAGKTESGEALIAWAFKNRKMVDERLADIPEEKRVRTYMANPDLTTYGSGKYTGLMMKHAGAFNVAAATIKGYKQVSMEQVIGWNPDVIFVQDRYPQVIKEIGAGPVWSDISAVKNGRVYLMPEYAKAWGYPMPEALALGELWMAKKLYPARFEDIDMQKEADAYYQRFYRVAWTEQ